MTTIYLLRHGALTGDNRERFVGQINLPLAAEGVRQAEALAQVLRDRGISIIYCSELLRSRQTAEIIARKANFRVETCQDFREIAMGDWEGLSRHEIATRFPDLFDARGRDLANFQVPGGESFATCQQRALAAWETILGRATSNCGSEHIAIVGHAGINRVLLCHLLGIPIENLFRIGQDYGCINVVEQRSGRPCVALLNGRPKNFLRAGE